MKILKGNDVTEEIYLKTWELDNNTFNEEDRIEKEKALEWFYASNKSIIVAYDEKKQRSYGIYILFFIKAIFF